MQEEKDERYYTVGVIVTTHALKGEVKVLASTDFPVVRFRKGSKLYLRKPGQTPIRELVVQGGRSHKNVWIVSFEDVNSIAEVENWKRMELCIPQGQLQSLPKGTYYIHDLVGLQVVTDKGQEIGELVEVLTPGANDVYVVRGVWQKQAVLIPAIPDCILDVDLERKIMRVHLLPGLVDDES